MKTRCSVADGMMGGITVWVASVLIQIIQIGELTFRLFIRAVWMVMDGWIRGTLQSVTGTPNTGVVLPIRPIHFDNA